MPQKLFLIYLKILTNWLQNLCSIKIINAFFVTLPTPSSKLCIKIHKKILIARVSSLIVFTSIIQSIIFQHHIHREAYSLYFYIFYYLPSDQRGKISSFWCLMLCVMQVNSWNSGNIRFCCMLKKSFMPFSSPCAAYKQQKKRIKQIFLILFSFMLNNCLCLPFSLRRLKSMHPNMWC